MQCTASAGPGAACCKLSGERRHTLWKGPMCCSPAYDLKFSRVMEVMMRRLAGPAALPNGPGEAILAVCCARGAAVRSGGSLVRLTAWDSR